jgi:hypothetical protein
MSGNIMFIAYKGSLTTILTLNAESMPFNGWASFLDTDFKLIFDRSSKLYYIKLQNEQDANQVLEERTEEGKTFYERVSFVIVLKSYIFYNKTLKALL